jgi:predicted O-methyltransferase YrrM
MQLPSVIDYSNFKASIKTYGSMEKESWKLGYYAFNYAPELIPFFAILKRDNNIDAVVETGTFIGGSTVAFSLVFDEVHTIEITPSTYQTSLKNLHNFPNVQCHLGSSEKVLHELLPSLEQKRVLFYLDAHWQQHWPLLQELEEIAATHKDNCIIVIDDFKVPNRTDIPYDAYHNNECSYEYIKNHLDLVFTEYTYHYLIPKSVDSRAKFIAIPKKWKG